MIIIIIVVVIIIIVESIDAIGIWVDHSILRVLMVVVAIAVEFY